MSIPLNIAEVLASKGITKLYGYTRKSREDEEGIEKHIATLEEFATNLGLPIEIFFETASSESIDDKARPELAKVKAGVKSGQIQALVILRLDRLSRKVTDLERLIGEFNFHNLILIECHNGGKIVNYKEKLGIKLESIMNDLYLESAKMLLAEGRRRSVALYGYNVGGEAPMGYDYDKNTKRLVPNEQAHIIQYIFNRYLEIKNTHTIATELNQMGYKTRKGAEIRGKTVWLILKNVKYKGWQTYAINKWHKDTENQRVSKPNNPEDVIIYEGAHEAIIDATVFDRVQELLSLNAKMPIRERSRSYPFTGVVRCGKCGALTTFTTVKGKIYHKACQKIDYMTGELCGNGNRPYQEIDDFIREQIWKVARPAILDLNEKLSKDPSSVRSNNTASEAKALEKELGLVNTKIGNLIDVMLERGVDQIILTKEKELKAQKASIEARLANLHAEETTEEMAEFDRWMELSEDLLQFPQIWKYRSQEQKNIMVRKYVKEVTHTAGEPLKIIFTDIVQKAINLKRAEDAERRNRRNKKKSEEFIEV